MDYLPVQTHKPYNNFSIRKNPDSSFSDSRGKVINTRGNLKVLSMAS